MSKSKGNVIDPLEVMDRFGTDALRFTLASMASPGRDIKLSAQRIEGYRNFANKIWNASRFILLQEGGNLPRGGEAGFDPGSLLLPDRWILSRLQWVIKGMEENLSEYRFDEAAHLFYQFFWYEFCDSYLEFSKLHLQEPTKRQTLGVLRYGLDVGLRLLHPFMPFITEEIWQHLDDRDRSVMVSPYPKPVSALLDPRAEEETGVLLEAIRVIRRLRSELSIPPGQSIDARFKLSDPRALSILKEGRPYLEKLCRLSSLSIGLDLPRPPSSAMSVTPFGEVYLPLAGLIDIDSEKDRLRREMEKTSRELSVISAKLDDPNFRSKAPSHVVEKDEGRAAELKEKLAKLKSNLEYFE
jgi:valyl-tRNA synthetase